jgi:phage terminase large subunit-like protein
MEWSTACPDWRERIVRSQSLIPCPPLFPAEAEAALRYFNDLPVVDVVGSPAFGDIARPWVTEFVASIFGAFDPVSERRLIKEFFLLISKKNGKSTLAAGIMVTALLLNWRNSAEFIILAPTLKVANNSAKAAMDMVSADPELGTYLKAIPHERKIVHLTTGASLTVVAADSNTVSGIKATGVLIDELWLFGKKSRAEEMLREATGGLMSRPEGFVIALSTQSDEPPTGVFKDWLERFRKIRDGQLIVPRALGLLYEFPEEMIRSEAYKLPENFYITNPNMGASVDEPTLLDEFEKERLKGPKSLVGFFAKHLNVEPGMAARADSWAGAEFWKRRADRTISLDSILKRCEVIIVSTDGGGLDDLYGLNVLGRETIEVDVDDQTAREEADNPQAAPRQVKRWLSWSHAWAQEIVLDRRKSIASKLRELEAAGDLTILRDGAIDRETGLPADIAQILKIIIRIRDAGLLNCVAVDPAGLGELVDALAAEQIVAENAELGHDFLVGVPQGFRLMNALKTAERKLANGTLLHADQPLMDWCVANLKIEPTATAIRATKQNAGDAKIDPAMALFNGVTMMALNPEACRSVYEERGLIIL